MLQIKKGNQWHFGMKAHIAVDADSGLVHTVTTTAANETDVEQIADLLHGKELHVWADSGCRGAQARVDREVRFRGFAKNTAHVVTLFALSNLWMARRQLLAMAQVRPRQPAGGRRFDGGARAQPLSHQGDPEQNYDCRKPGRLRRLCPARTEAC